MGWNTDGTVIDSLRLTNWSGGYPDVYAVPDLATYRPLPWRPRVGHVISDIVAHDRSPSLLDPRAVLKRVLARLASLGYTAKVGVEFELYLLNPDGSPFQDDIHAYSLENANALDPLLSDLYETLGAFTRLEGIQTEYGPGQIETNLVYTDALEAADDAARLKYAAKEVARRHGKIASFMPKPFTEHSGSSQHLHISLWRGDEPHSPRSTAPTTSWRCTQSPVCSSIFRRSRCSSPTGPRLIAASRRTRSRRRPSSGAATTGARRSVGGRQRFVGHPHRAAHWGVGFQPLLADCVGVGRGHRRARGQNNAPPARGGNLYSKGVPLPESLGTAVALATRDDTTWRFWARTPCGTSRPSPAASGRCTSTMSATGSAGAT